MDNDVSWEAIIHNFGFTDIAVTKFTDNYLTGRYLMVYNLAHIKYVINQQNKIYRNHAGPNQRCYINAIKMNLVLILHRWAVLYLKYSGAEYDTVSATVFDHGWVYSIIDE